MTPPGVLSASIPKNAYQVSIVESKQRPLCENELFGRKGKCLQDGDKWLIAKQFATHFDSLLLLGLVYFFYRLKYNDSPVKALPPPSRC
ncbi:hypothetical protein TNCT_178161 [Trichonephila clavata]|uniref:Uncharacterized protein n=1 Tax=Trichonephila clavata TaxID=2740835 RepID=A0A8X6LVD2_TRICU|nr:hypothetical protein TNCT_178161 [Trichonephila clavata]